MASMSRGEMLLRDYPEHVSVKNSCEERIQQLLTEYESMDEVIERLCVRSKATSEPPSTSGGTHSNPTERIALTYRDRASEERRELAATILAMHNQVKKSTRQINLFKAVYQGLNEEERWIVDVYYHGDASQAEIAEVLKSHGERNATQSSVSRKLKKLISKVNRRLQTFEEQGNRDS